MVQEENLIQHSVGAVAHRPELEQGEFLTIFPEPALTEEDRTAARYPDAQGNRAK
jgi:hypothetical protein